MKKYNPLTFTNDLESRFEETNELRNVIFNSLESLAPIEKTTKK